MGQVNFLNDSECRSTIVRLTSEAAKRWAPDEVDMVDVAADEYFYQVQEAGHILYPAKARGQPLELGTVELMTLVILPVATGFVGNLLAGLCVETFKELRSKRAQQQGAEKPGTSLPPDSLRPDRIRPLIKREAQASGLNPKQVEQLARIFSNVISELLSAGGEPLKRNDG